MMTRAVGYIRVSTENQVEEGLSLEIQREEIIKNCDDNRYELIQIYEDAGISGSTLDRPALLSLLDSAKAGEFDMVIIYCLDRLARDLYTQLFIEKELEVAGVGLYSVCEPDINKNDPMTVALRQMKGVFAQLERAMIKRRLAMGRLRKHRDGGYAGGGLPLGYRSYREGRSHSKLIVDEEEAKIIHYIRKLRKQGWTFEAIAEELNQKGYRTKRGCSFFAMSVKRIFDNPIYKGKIRYAGEVREGIHKPIV